MLNPELRRYQWTELSLHKLIAMPVVLGGAFALADITDIGVAQVAYSSFMIIFYLWGTRRTAAAVAEEMRGGTWDSQRMSALDAWPMTWGKLFGSSIYPWYGALICLAVFAAFVPEQYRSMVLGRTVIVLVLAGVIAQAVALAASLAFLRKHRGERNIPVTLCHLAGLIMIGLLAYHPQAHDFWELGKYHRTSFWYGARFPQYEFFVTSSLIIFGWAVLAVHRLMRAELQHRTLPWGWAAFTLYLVVFLSGFGQSAAGMNLTRLAVGFAITIAMVYVVFLLENKNVIAVKAWVDAVRGRRWFAMAKLTPSWLVCLCLAVAISVAYALSALNASAPNPFGWLPSGVVMKWEFAIAILFFVLRDIGFLLFMNLGTRLRRPDFAGAIYLALLYIVGGAILYELDIDVVLAFVIPYDTGNALLTVIPPLIQAVAVCAVLVYRLRGTLYPAAVQGADRRLPDTRPADAPC